MNTGKTREYGGHWDTEVDVVVAGAGGAGLSAAIEASDAGASVIVLEKQGSMFDCSTAQFGGMMSFAGTDLQKELGIEDSNDKFYKDIMDIGKWKGIPELVRIYVDNQLDTYYWLKSLGVTMALENQSAGMVVPRGHAVSPIELVQLLVNTAKKKGVPVVYRAAVVDLLTDSQKRVIGVKVEERNGTTHVRARKGVILATGGFARDTEKMKSLDPRFVTQVINCAGRGTTGDGHRMAKALGAYEKDVEYVKPLYGEHVVGTSVSEMSCLYLYGPIIVNKKGERYINESASPKDVGAATLKQPEGVGFTVFDKKLFDAAVKRTDSCNQLGAPEYLVGGLDKGRIGLLLEGNTIEELASQMRVPPQALKQTVESYNSYMQAGKDVEFGVSPFPGLFRDPVKIDTPPFYAFEEKGMWCCTHAGIVADINMHVLARDGIIKGLYAAGEIMAFHGANAAPGTSVNSAITFGRIAGRNAANAV